MVSGGERDAPGIVSLALDFHRAPTRHADLLRGPASLPPGVATLLKLAGGSEPDPAALALAPADELKAAALFFVEQVLFRHDASHYRVLGLPPEATPGQLKEHHRLLMRVFHPDRENRADDWKDAFATRINLAYTTLRDASGRRRYDAALRQGPRPGSASVPHPPAVHRRPRPAPRRGPGLPPLILSHLPQWVLAGTALVALGLVGVVYLDNPQVPALQQDERPEPPPGDMAAAAVGVPAAATEAGTGTAPPPAGQIPQAEPHRVDAATAVAPAVDAAARQPLQAAPRVPRHAALAPEFGPPATTPGAAPQAPADEPLKLAPALASLESTATPPAAPAPVALPAPDAAATLERFVASYERGDTPALMALFDEVAIGSMGGKTQIRREHEALFRTTELRHIAIDGMTWTRDGDWYHGVGRYRATQMRKGEPWLRSESGTIRIELQQRGGQALIMGLDYQPRERS